MPTLGCAAATGYRREFLSASWNCVLGLSLNIVDVKNRETVFVGDKIAFAAIVGEIEFVHIPGDGRREICVFFAGQINVSQPVKFGVLVGGRVNSFAVFAEAAARVGDFFTASLRREQDLLARLGIHHPMIAFVGGDLLIHEDF